MAPTDIARRPEPPVRTRPEDALWNHTLTPHQRIAVARKCEEYHLDAYLGHVNVLGGRITISLEGYLEIANRSPQFDGFSLTPIVDREIKSALGYQPTDVVILATVWRKDRDHGHEAYGGGNSKTVAAELRGQKLVSEVVQARALRRGLRAAFSPRELALPEDEDDDEQAAAVPPDPRDYAQWWMRVKADLGLDNAQVHTILGVDSVKQVEDLGAAYERLREAAAVRDELARQAPGAGRSPESLRDSRPQGQATDTVDTAPSDLDDDDLDDEADAEDDPLRQDALAGLAALRGWAADGASETGAGLPVGDGHVRSVAGMAERLGLSPPDLRTLLYEAFGVEQLAELRRAQARAFLTWAAKTELATRQARHILMLEGHL